FAAMEKARLAKLAREWLEVESRRAPFEVVAVEREGSFRIGNLELKGRIDRLDRLADGSHAVIDYKTGERVNPQDWSDPERGRPREPQLTIYATASAEPMGAVAFARVKAGKMRFAGFSRGKDVIPQVAIARHWPGLLEGWQKGLARLAGDFEAGDARVDPRDGAATCRTCDLQTVCRVHERFAFLDEAGGEPE
ncbi:MAG TPA: PD-(D/E)XK nuclease family protein, partial [Burkholderiales bacterium]|nr:PD-(D/E)XK nuclease family protein [Burkholderiales bacterium]